MGQECLTRAGAAQGDITPDFETELIGGWWQNPLTRETLHPLALQALALERGPARFCLLSMDSLGLTQALSDALREDIARALGTTRARVMLNFSHTHAAPAPLSPVNGERYLALLRERALSCARAALAALAPCRACWAAVDAPGVNDNRRPGGTACDSRLGALHIVNARTGAPIALAARFCAHANVLMRGVDGRAVISSDYIGLARQRLQARFGCPVLFLQGAAGNLKIAGTDKITGGTPADALRAADMLDAAAGRLAFGAYIDPAPDMREVEMTFASAVPSEARAREIADSALRECFTPGEGWLTECARLRAAGVTTQTQRGALQSLSIAGGCLCGVPYEIFCETALWAQARADTPYFFLNGYTNGCAGYLPGAEEWDKGGFETLYSYLTFYPFHGRVMPFERGAAQTIAEAALALYAAQK